MHLPYYHSVELRPCIRSNVIMYSCKYYQIMYKDTGREMLKVNHDSFPNFKFWATTFLLPAIQQTIIGISTLSIMNDLALSFSVWIYLHWLPLFSFVKSKKPNITSHFPQSRWIPELSFYLSMITPLPSPPSSSLVFYVVYLTTPLT